MEMPSVTMEINLDLFVDTIATLDSISKVLEKIFVDRMELGLFLRRQIALLENVSR
jgi:hypothetical protein